MFIYQGNLKNNSYLNQATQKNTCQMFLPCISSGKLWQRKTWPEEAVTPIWWICYGACSPSFGLTKETNSRPLFSISQASVSKIFTTWITILYHVFKEVLITWPSKELEKRHLLKFFFKYPRTRVIIDCTGLKIEKPGAPSSQKVTWSDYKSHNTFKLLECWNKPFKSI